MVLPAFLCVFTPWKVIITANVHELSDMNFGFSPDRLDLRKITWLPRFVNLFASKGQTSFEKVMANHESIR